MIQDVGYVFYNDEKPLAAGGGYSSECGHTKGVFVNILQVLTSNQLNNYAIISDIRIYFIKKIEADTRKIFL